MAIRIGEVKSSRLTDDKKEVIVSGSGKYVGDVELKIARECLDDFIDALVSARGTLGSVTVLSADSAVVPKWNARSRGNPNEVRFEIPKTFAVTADTEGRGLVLLILNHRLENQEGYALSPDAARQVAAGLTKSADALLASPVAGELNK